PVLEEAQIVYKLDLYVVDCVIEKIKAVKEKGLYLVPQSVNLSRTDFDCCDIVGEICKKMDAAGLSHELLTIEITEKILGNNYEYLKNQILRFRNLGFQVWLDDFGNGNTAMRVLKDNRVDLIKFDMEFVKELEKNGNGKIVISELIRMATALDIETVCEGVENEEQVRFLREIGCTKLQGFYYCSPLPLDKVFERYDKGLQIGFENPDESAYYDSIGSINLYDPTVLTKTSDPDGTLRIKDLPMAILEISGKNIYITRSNESLRTLFKKELDIGLSDEKTEIFFPDEGVRDLFLTSISTWKPDEGPVLIDEKLPDGTVWHTYFRNVAENPLSGTRAVAFAILKET
ncbi:MAG: EAL domain-containing protein, partial [Lachnospiraceae bacterium]|nr:EAL domain-containing protein [Lachnospiraceae bacterium]